MPTNILRAKAKLLPKARTGGGAVDRSKGPRRIAIAAGKASLIAELFDTPTADRIWAALPIYSTAETWGASIHFETPVESGRERGARMLCEAGDVCFWSEEDRVIIGFGLTPVSRPGEIRLPRPCNVFARAQGAVGGLNIVRPGEKVSITAVKP